MYARFKVHAVDQLGIKILKKNTVYPMYTISLYWNKVFKLNSEHNVQILEILTI